MDVREFILTNRHGKRMPATVRLPENVIGAAIVLHGLGGWKDQPVIEAMADTLAEHGYASVTFNASDSALAPDGDFYHSTNTGYLEDLEDAVASLKKESWFTTQFMLAGHSQGGVIAVRYARLNPAHVQKLILTAPGVSWKMGALFWMPFVLPWLITGTRYWKAPHGTKRALGRQWIFDFLKFDGYEDARHITMPTLIISAGGDTTVAKPYEHRRFARMFPNATHRSVPGAPHPFTGHERAVAATISTWLTSS